MEKDNENIEDKTEERSDSEDSWLPRMNIEDVFDSSLFDFDFSL